MGPHVRRPREHLCPEFEAAASEASGAACSSFARPRPLRYWNRGLDAMSFLLDGRAWILFDMLLGDELARLGIAVIDLVIR